MKRLTREQQKLVVDQWRKAAPALAQARDAELKEWRYDSETVDALLEIGAKSPRGDDEPNGLVEMQRLFMKAARKQGRLPYVVRNEGGGAGVPPANSREAESGAGVPPAISKEAAGTAAPLKAAGQRPAPHAAPHCEKAGQRPAPHAAPHCEKAGQRPAPHAAPQLYIVGDAAILGRPKIALFCSVKCPGKLILETYDLAKRFRNEGVLVISPFHSPMEQECLRILLRSPQPVIWALARGVYRQIPSKPVECRNAAAEGRLIMVTPFPDTVRHITAETATTRNQLVVKLADAVVIAHAAPGSKMEALCRDILAARKPLYTFDHPANAALIESGAQSIATLNLDA
ncbi:MAG: DNA-processing protein DprA [Kiritimatiellae bacterium]|nr:DNA-processing protein DprA [Kiritimatiellia bacterium]MDD4026471.1 DNA-processing protein DprA [Kiritimatiellia bacterium]